MSELLAALARAVSHHWKRSLAIAVASLVILIAIAGTSGSAPPNDFTVPGSESQAAIDLFAEHTPALAGVDSNVIFSTEDGTLRTPERQAAIESAIEEIRTLPSVISVSDPFDPGTPQISEDGRIAAADVRYELDYGEVEVSDGEMLEEAARTAESGGVDVSLRGPVVDVASQQEAPIGELVGIAIAILLLTMLFRSGAAMFATLIGALIGVMTGQVLLVILTGPLGLPDFAPTIALMLGLGAGIDYALLIIGRFREQSAAGDSVRDAAAKAAATAGSAVVAAGLIVMVAIAGLLVIGIPFVGKLGIGAAIGVAAVVVSALTFLPIMIGALPEAAETEEVAARSALGRICRLGREDHRPARAGDWRRRNHSARVRNAGSRHASRPARRRQPAGRKDPANRLRQAERRLRTRLERAVSDRRRYTEGRSRDLRSTQDPRASPEAGSGRGPGRSPGPQRRRGNGNDRSGADQLPAGCGNQ